MAVTVELKSGRNGLPMLAVDTPFCTGEVYLHGAHITHFHKKSEAHPILWMSAESKFSPTSPIRGGIPVIFPWFGPREGMPAHGFARTSVWDLVKVQTTDWGGVRLDFSLNVSRQNPEFAAIGAEYRVTLGESLEIDLRMTNLSPDKPLRFDQCLHTYFNVGDISNVSVAGLKGVGYLDKVGGTTEKMETHDVIKVTSEVDRVYQDTLADVEIRDAGLGRTILVAKEGSLSTVVWNPWISKSKAMADFGDEEYHRMICVESGSVGKNSIELPPGHSSSLKVRLSSRSGA